MERDGEMERRNAGDANGVWRGEGREMGRGVGERTGRARDTQTNRVFKGSANVTP